MVGVDLLLPQFNKWRNKGLMIYIQGVAIYRLIIVICFMFVIGTSELRAQNIIVDDMQPPIVVNQDGSSVIEHLQVL